MEFVQILLYLLYAYLGLGLIFALWFILKGADRLDDQLHGASWRTRLLLLPGSMALWVVLLNKYLKHKQHGS